MTNSRTAVIYSGQARTIRHVWPNHIWHLFRKLDWTHTDVFVSVADDAEAEDMKLLGDKLFGYAQNFYFEKVVQPEIPEPTILARWHSGYPAAPVQAVLKQLWALNRAWQFAGEKRDIREYAQVIRMRPDIAFCRFDYTKDTFPLHCQCITPWFARWGGINDRFAILNSHAAKAYFTTFEVREELWKEYCPVHPETMIDAALRRAGYTPSCTAPIEFTLIRNNPKPGEKEVYPIDASNVDIAEYARVRSFY